MALQFILGGVGSGKTRILYNRVVRESMEHPEQGYPVTVPEQFVIQTQKETIRLRPRHGIINIDVLSFRYLVYRIFEDLGVGIPVVLGDMGKSMVLRKVTGLKRGRLSLYKGHLEQSGLIGQLKSQISELSQYGITPDMLRGVRGETDAPLLAQKLEDLEVICNGFGEYMESHYIMAGEILDILCREPPRWEPLKDSIILLNGYTGFTPVQYRLVELLLMHARDVMCTVTVDSRENAYEEGSIQRLFYMSHHMVCRVTSTARRHGIPEKEGTICNRCPTWWYDKSPELDFLEQSLYRYPGRTWEGNVGRIQVYKGHNPAGEAAYVHSRIEQMIKEEGMRHRGAAIITGNLPPYGRELARQFDKAGIPYFLDVEKSVLENPMVELIRAALEMAKDFSYESVFRYLKTGLVCEKDGKWMESEADRNIAQADDENILDDSRKHVEQMTDRLENYVRALGTRGWRQWDSYWERQYKGGEKLNMKELNEYRVWILEPSRPLRKTFKAEETTIASVAAALRQFLKHMRPREKLEEYRDFLLERGEPGDENLTREYGQVYDRALELFERLEGLLRAEKADMGNYIQILDVGFQGIQMGVIPATIDRVMVGDITRSRLEAVKVLSFVGVNEGTVLQRESGVSLLSGRDKAALRKMDMELAPIVKEDGCVQKFYLYLMMSEPSGQLVITYAGLTLSGKNQRPSNFMGEVGKLFPRVEILDEHSVEWPVRTGRDARKLFIKGLRGIQEQGEDDRERGEATSVQLFQHFYASAKHRDKVGQLMDVAFYSYEEGETGRAAARALYGRKLQGSVIRLEQFASCVYTHFLRYGPELIERQEYGLEAVDMGNLFHQPIDRCFACMKDRGQDWRGLTEEGRKSLAKECMTQVAEEYGNAIISSSAHNAYLAGRMERITDRTVWALAEQMKKGGFEPVGFGVSFSVIDNLEAMHIGLSEDEELRLRGRIDRMGLCRDGDHVYVKVIDCELGTTSFDLAAPFYGLQLQLVAYMDAAVGMEERRHPDKEVVPADIFYYHIGDPMVNKQGGMDEKNIKEQILKQLRMNGLVNSKLDIVHHLNREIEKESDVIPVAIGDGYVQESRSSIASTRRFQDLCWFMNRELREVGQDILMGNIDLKPYKQGNRTACDYCPYHTMCGFDTKTVGHGYRRLRELRPEEIWAELEVEGDEGTDGNELGQ